MGRDSLLMKRLNTEAMLKSAYYSTKIEGNKMSLKTFNKILRKELENQLPLRRQEILNVVRDHPYVSFDFIRRRFFSVNPKTLHYDLKKLQDQNLIVKVGATRGAVYRSSADK